MYQFGRLAAEFLQVDVEGIVRAVHLAAVMNKIGHLDVEQQRLVGILDIEGVETSAFGNHRHVGLLTEILSRSLDTDDVLRTVRLARNQIRRTEIHVTDSRGKDDMGRLVIRHFQTVRRNHPVKGELSGQPVIEVAVLLLRIDIRLQGQIIYGRGISRLCMCTCNAACEGKHQKNLFHVFTVLMGY